MKKIILSMFSILFYSSIGMAQQFTSGYDNVGTPFPVNSSKVIGGESALIVPVTYTYVGSFKVGDGPCWNEVPATYTAQEAAAFVFGGLPSDYGISVDANTTDPTTITHTAYLDGYGADNYLYAPAAENFKAGTNYVWGSYSAFVKDHTDGNDTGNCAYTQGMVRVNHVWRAVTNPYATTLNSASCGITLAGWYSTVSANGVSMAQAYRFKITPVDALNNATGTSVDYDRPVNNIALANVAGTTYNSRYRFEVAVRIGGVWQAFGAACYVNTPTAVSTIALCGSTLTAMNQWITSTPVANVTSYRYRVTQLDSSLNPVGSSQEITQTANKFNMTQFAGYLYATNYRVEVSVRNTDGNYLPYGTACTIATPAHPTSQLQASQCNTVATGNTQLFYATPVSGATAYRFKVSYVVPGDPTSPLNYNMTYTNNSFNRFTLNNFPGLQAGLTYSVEVSVKLASEPDFGPFGNVCGLTTPGGVQIISKVLDTKALKPASVEFSAVAYPNPFANNFKLNVNTISEESIQVTVYDMLGKQVEARKINASDLESFEVGNNFTSGIYNVVVSQGENLQTLRVIKR